MSTAKALIASEAEETQVQDVMLRGLSTFSSLSEVLIYRVKIPWEELSQNKNQARYAIVDNTGKVILNAVETCKPFERHFLSDLRSFDLVINEPLQNTEVFSIRRHLRADCCYCPYFLQALDVFTFPDNTIGRIIQEWAVCRPKFVIELPSNDILCRVRGSCCTMRCCVRDLNFEVWSRNSLYKLATISRQWSGTISAGYEDTRLFGVGYHREVNSLMKVLILSACFLVNALYYQN